MTNIEPGQGTRKFKPHRADGKRTSSTRRTLPSTLSGAVGLVAVIMASTWYGEAYRTDNQVERIIAGIFIGMGAAFLLGWVRDLARWHADKD